ARPGDSRASPSRRGTPRHGCYHARLWHDTPFLQAAAPSGRALALACLAGDASALRALDAVLAAEVERLRPQRRDADGAAELHQRLRDKLLVAEKLREFRGDSSLQRWLRMVALRTHLDLLRAAGREPTRLTDDGELDVLAASDDTPELDYLK